MQNKQPEYEQSMSLKTNHVNSVSLEAVKNCEALIATQTNEVDSPVYGCNSGAVIVRRMGFRLTQRIVEFMSQPLYKHLTGGEALMSATWRVVGCAALNDLWLPAVK